MRKGIFFDEVEGLWALSGGCVSDPLESLTRPTLGGHKTYKSTGSSDRAIGQADKGLVAVPATAQEGAHPPDGIELPAGFLWHVEINCLTKFWHPFSGGLAVEPVATCFTIDPRDIAFGEQRSYGFSQPVHDRVAAWHADLEAVFKG